MTNIQVIELLAESVKTIGTPPLLLADFEDKSNPVALKVDAAFREACSAPELMRSFVKALIITHALLILQDAGERLGLKVETLSPEDGETLAAEMGLAERREAASPGIEQDRQEREFNDFMRSLGYETPDTVN